MLDSINNLIASPTSWAIAGAVGYYLYKKYFEIISKTDNLGYLHSSDINIMPSFANPAKVISGYKWSNISNLSTFNNANKANANKLDLPLVYVDNFSYHFSTTKTAKINKTKQVKAEQTKIYFSPLDCAKQLLAIGSMSSGKSQFFLSLLTQKWYNRAIIHDSKGEYSELLLGDKKHYATLNIYDTRGVVWDIMSEKDFHAIIKLFCTNLITAAMGKSGGDNSFFSTSAINRMVDMFLKVHDKYPDVKDAKKRWTLLINEIRTYINFVDSLTQKSSETDVKNSLLLAIEILEVMAYRIINGANTITITKFFAMQDVTLLLGYGANRKGLEAYYSGFMAAVVNYHLSLPETKTDFTFYLLDEYLTFKFDEETRDNLHTMIRGKGGVCVMGMQFLPMDDTFVKDLLDSSRYALFVFSTDSEATKQHIIKQIDKVVYEHRSESESTHSEQKGKNKSFNFSKQESQIVTMDILNNPGAFKHITFIPKAQPQPILYLGYTQSVNLQKTAPNYIGYDLTKFNLMRLNTEKVDGDVAVDIALEDIYKPVSQRLKNYEKFDLFLKWSAAQGDAKESILSQKGLVETDTKHLFDEYVRNDQIIESKMKMFSEKERLKLFIEWKRLDKANDAKAKYDFIEKYGLFGALPDFFIFSEQILTKLEEAIKGAS